MMTHYKSLITYISNIRQTSFWQVWINYVRSAWMITWLKLWALLLQASFQMSEMITPGWREKPQMTKLRLNVNEVSTHMNNKPSFWLKIIMLLKTYQPSETGEIPLKVFKESLKVVVVLGRWQLVCSWSKLVWIILAGEILKVKY